MTNNKITIKNVTLRYPNLTKKRENKPGDTRPAKYGTTVIISKDDKENLDKIKEAVNNAIIIGNIADCKDIIYPLKDGDRTYPGEKIFENSVYFYTSSNIKPIIVDKKVNKLYVPDDCLNGQYANLSIEFCSYNFNSKTGISAKLHNVQVLDRNRLEELRSNPFDDFEAED